MLTEEERKAQFVVCESYPGYRRHIRPLLGGQPVLGGYTEPHEALCGRIIERGSWDTQCPLPTPATKERYCESLLGAFTVCRECCVKYLKRAW